MKTKTITGWLFDAGELGPQVLLWIHTGGGIVRVTHEFAPPVFVSGSQAKLKRLASDLVRQGIITGVRWERKQEFWSGQELAVLQLNVADTSLLPRLREMAAALDEELTFYDLDIPPVQHYLYLHRLFPLCRLSTTVDSHSNVIEIKATNSAWEIDQPTPALRILYLRGMKMRPLTAQSTLILRCEDKDLALRFPDGSRLISTINKAIAKVDPDVILSERGDSVLLPAILKLAKETKSELVLDRDPVKTNRKIETEGRTFYSYGKVVYKGPSYPLFGRWHIDLKNSFTYDQSGLEGLLELSRLAKVPVQRMARTSPGTAMTSMQLEHAVTTGILVPWRKSEPEGFKTVLQLLEVDKGGLSFQPPVGAFEQVAEIDFAAMYPSLMVTRNISPETVLCKCCENALVPEAGYNVCQKRKGLIPTVLAPLIERRKRYKRLIREIEDEEAVAVYDARATAIKWMLVTCFGYLGYKNARFGRIEAHEAVTALGRETLLQAKEIAEDDSFELLHALTDSLWIKKEGMTEAELASLCRKITAATGIEMEFEGLYHWIEFARSKQNGTRPVATRYFGLFTNGSLKIRGLACRRADTPKFIKAVQEELLSILAEATTLEERKAKQTQAHALLEEQIKQLEDGSVPLKDLLVEQVLSRAPEEYSVATRAQLAAAELIKAGVPVHPGERVGYVITNATSPSKKNRISTGFGEAPVKYDAREYVRQLKRAALEVLTDSDITKP